MSHEIVEEKKKSIFMTNSVLGDMLHRNISPIEFVRV